MSAKLTCDQCGIDVTNAGPMPNYRLRLTSEAQPHGGGAVFALIVNPDIPVGVYDFCSKRCLTGWLSSAEDS